jgi:DNA-binding response OmpR family regulator
MKRILVADDSETVSMLVSTALANAGYSVTTVDNGMAAFSVGSEQDIDLAIIDQLMPGLLGMEVLEKWKSDGRDFPVIMLSSVNDETTIVDSLRMGAVDFVRKPFLVKELTARVSLALQRR